MFYTNTKSGETVQEIYDKIYRPGFCRDTWFCLDGKPVIIAIESECSDETRDFFNIKMSQWPNEPDKLGGWPWMDFAKPQRIFCDLNGRPETLNVSVAQHLSCDSATAFFTAKPKTAAEHGTAELTINAKTRTLWASTSPSSLRERLKRILL